MEFEFHINSRMVAQLKLGRVLLGGDAANVHSPAGAQGMNAGIQDMINLSWKLALVVKGRAPSSILDTYESERLPVMRSILTHSEYLTRIASAQDPIVRSLIDHFGPWIGNAHFVQENAGAQFSQLASNTAAVRYRNSMRVAYRSMLAIAFRILSLMFGTATATGCRFSTCSIRPSSRS